MGKDVCNGVFEHPARPAENQVVLACFRYTRHAMAVAGYVAGFDHSQPASRVIRVQGERAVDSPLVYVSSCIAEMTWCSR